MATILITGGNGQLGSELKKISGQFSGYNFIFTDIAELDISDPTASNNFIAANKPEWIINCAAYNAVDKAETDFENAPRSTPSGKTSLSPYPEQQQGSYISPPITCSMEIITDPIMKRISPLPQHVTDNPNYRARKRPWSITREAW